MVLTRLSTIEDLRNIATADDDYELIEGVLAPMPPVDLVQGRVHANLFRHLVNHAHEHGRGQVVSEVGFTLHRDADSVLAPDLAFVPAARYPEETSGFAELAPDLVVEVISPGNSPGYIERKVAIYLEAGVRAIWIVYLRQRQIVVHTPDNPPAVFTEREQIDCGDVLSGLTVPVADIFNSCSAIDSAVADARSIVELVAPDVLLAAPKEPGIHRCGRNDRPAIVRVKGV